MKTNKNYLLKRTNLKYFDIGHGAGGILWWLNNKGKIQTFISTGIEFHHNLDRRINMDLRWRGRIEKETGRSTILPPIRIYQQSPECIRMPRNLTRMLWRLGGRLFYLDTCKGLYLIFPVPR